MGSETITSFLVIHSFARVLRSGLKWENSFFLIFLIPLVVNPWGSVSPSELAKVSFLMMFLGGALFFLALQTLFSPRIRDVYSWPVAIGFCLLLLLLVSSTIFSTEPLQSFWGTYERLQGLVTRLLVMALFLFCLRFFQAEARQRTLWGIVKLAGLIVALWGIVQYFTQDVSTPWSSGQLFAGRIFGTLGNPNDFGQFLIFPFMASLIGLFEKGAPWNRKPSSWIPDATCLMTVGIALALSQNRASILAVLVASFVYWIIQIKNTGARWAVLGLFLLSIGCFTAFGLANTRSLKTRLILWQNTLELSREHPWMGTGLETYTEAIQSTLSPTLYHYEKLSQIPSHPHNETLAILAEQGIVGLAGYGLIFVLFLIGIYRSKKNHSPSYRVAVFSLLAMLISLQFGFSLITQQIFIVASLAIVVLGLFKFTTVEFSVGFFRKMVIISIFLVIAIFLMGLSIRLLRVDNAINKAVSTTIEDRDLGLQSFQRLIDYSPPFAYLYRTTFIFFGGDLDSHIIDYDLLARINQSHEVLTPGGFEADAEQGVLAYARGDKKQARLFFESITKRAPAALRVYELWARLADHYQDYASALKATDSYLSIAPSYWRWGEDLESRIPEEREQYRIFMKSNSELLRILEINLASRRALGL